MGIGVVSQPGHSRCRLLLILAALLSATHAAADRGVGPSARAAGTGVSNRGTEVAFVQRRGPRDGAGGRLQTTGVWARGGTAAAAAGQAAGARAVFKVKYPIIKVLLFLYYMSLGSLFPYIPMFYKAMGYDGKRVGQLGAITPAAAFVTSALWGALADKTGNLKGILLLTFMGATCVRQLQPYTSNFYMQAAIVGLAAVLNAPVRPLLDSSVMALLDDKREYGKQRLFGQVGFGVGSYMMGPLLKKSAASFQRAFQIHGLISLAVLPVMLRFRPQKQQREKPRFREGISIVAKNSQAVLFFGMVFAIGLSSGVIENFAYIRIQQVGGSGKQLGMLRAASSIAGMPMFWFSGQLTKAIGVFGVLTCSLCSYIMRLLIYAQMSSPWMAMPAEILRGTTFASMWAASTYYANHIAPAGMHSTMIAFLNAMYQGLGQSSGALVGGFLIDRLGSIQNAYRVYAGFDALLLSLFVAFLARNRDYNTAGY